MLGKVSCAFACTKVGALQDAAHETERDVGPKIGRAEH
jgi:hypothetical protein